MKKEEEKMVTRIVNGKPKHIQECDYKKCDRIIMVSEFHFKQWKKHYCSAECKILEMKRKT